MPRGGWKLGASNQSAFGGSLLAWPVCGTLSGILLAKAWRLLP